MELQFRSGCSALGSRKIDKIVLHANLFSNMDLRKFTNYGSLCEELLVATSSCTNVLINKYHMTDVSFSVVSIMS